MGEVWTMDIIIVTGNHIIVCTVVSQVSARGCLNATCDFGLHGHLPGIKIPWIRLYRSCYCNSGPFKCGTLVLTQEWALA